MLVPRFYRLAALALLVLLSGCDLLGGADEIDVEVVRLDGMPLTADQAPTGWKVASRHEDRLTLELFLEAGRIGPAFRGALRGVQFGETVFLTLSAVSGELPVFEDLWVGTAGGGGHLLKKGRIRIQDWNPDGRMSGSIEGTLAGPGDALGIAFWIEPDSTSGE